MGMTELQLTDTGREVRGRAVFRLDRHFTYSFVDSWCDMGRITIVVRVPKGYETDFASIPRPAWWLLPPTGAWRRAAVFHDYLCDIGTPRFLTDAIFRHIMEETGVKVWQRVVIYYTVRSYWLCWGRWFSN